MQTTLQRGKEEQKQVGEEAKFSIQNHNSSYFGGSAYANSPVCYVVNASYYILFAHSLHMRKEEGKF